MRRDARGNPVSTASAAALDASEQALWRMMSFYGTPIDDLDAAIVADPAWLLPRLMKAGFLLSLTEPSLLDEARDALAGAERLAASADAREIAHGEALRAVAEGDWDGACARWQGILGRHPRDALALQWAHLFDFYRGDAEQLRERPARALPHWPAGDTLLPFVIGLHAFGLEETGRFADAEVAGRDALERDPRVPWAIHAVGHVMEMQGRFDEGLRWMEDRRPQWVEGNGFSCHLGWHHALFALEALDPIVALRLFDEHLDPASTQITLQRLDAASLLWRCMLVGVDVGQRWRSLLDAWPLDDGSAGFSVFNDLHALLALVGVGDLDRARRYVRHAQASAGRAGQPNGAVMRDLGAQLLEGVLAFGCGRFDEATRLLGLVRPALARIGGSHAQREVVAQTLLSAAARSGARSVGLELLEERRQARPSTPLSRHWAERLGAMPR
ncbi:MAG: tetratricopeptide repeat protein [Caldimonas sp.]